MADRRVVITGFGIISCVGNTVDKYWNALIYGKSGIKQITNFDISDYRTKIAGEIIDFNPKNYLSDKELKRLDRFCQFAIGATDDAIKMAGLSKEKLSVVTNLHRIGVLIGSGIGGIESFGKQVSVLYNKGPKSVSSFTIPSLIINLVSGNIAMRYNIKGPNMSIVTACSASTHSIGEAYWVIKRDDADIMITGGAEASITPIACAGFCSMRAMSISNLNPKGASRPFDLNRNGFVMAEGAGVLILEELEYAKKRRANIYAEIIGYGASADAYHITAPDPQGVGINIAINTALKHARISKNEINSINAHGTSTKLNDKFETVAYKKYFGELAYKININSIKGTIGHSLGAAGAMDSISCIKSIMDNIIPPTINYENIDKECNLNYTPNIAVEKNVEIVLNLNCGFGGHNAVIIFKKFK